MPTLRRKQSKRVIGREAELGALDAFLTGASTTIALTIAGPAGIGKTTLFDVGIQLAKELGYTILLTRPGAAESSYAFSALSDLLQTISTDIIETLPSPQREALDAAMLRSPAPIGGVDERALGAAMRSILEASLATGRTLIAIDDTQWMDQSTNRVLTYALRRMVDAPVLYLATVRTDDSPPNLSKFGPAFPPTKCQTMEIGPLSLSEVHDLIERYTGLPLSRPLLTRIDLICSGNPLYALEIARALRHQRNNDTTSDIPIPPSISASIAERISQLPLDTRCALLDAALLAQPNTELVDSVSLTAAEAAGMVTFDFGRIRFTHPMIAAVATQLASSQDRRARHDVLADLVDDPEESARHRALAQCGVDAEVSSQLNEAARHAAQRGATYAAGELADLALLLTPSADGPALAERRISAARLWIAAGDLDHAGSIIKDLITSEPDPMLLAHALQLLGQIHIRRADLGAAINAATEALAVIGDEPNFNAALHLDLAFYVTNLGDLDEATAHADAAVINAQRDPNHAQLASALSIQAITRFLGGKRVDVARLDQAEFGVQTQTTATNTTMSRPQLVRALLQLWTGDLDNARVGLSAVHAELVARGEESEIPVLTLYQVWADLWAGDFVDADRLADEAITISELLDDPLAKGFAHSARALVHAHRGQCNLATREADLAAGQFVSLQFNLGMIWPYWAKGLAALSIGDLKGVDTALGPLARMVTSSPGDPVLGMFLPDEIEALIGLGQPDVAQPLLDWFTDAAQRLDRSWAQAAAARCRAILLGSAGDLAAAQRSADDALELGATVGLPFERARSLLVAGQILRRRTHRAEACVMFDEARSEFARLGATSWQARASDELNRIAGRRDSRDALTITEQIVAELAAQGLSNREIADRAFISIKAVEANLTRVYRKLGIRSRSAIVWHITSPTLASPEQIT